jgi:hypothetical protein
MATSTASGLLSGEENFAVLGHLVDHFEQRMPQPMSLPDQQVRLAPHRHRHRRAGFGHPDSTRLKLSQNKEDPPSSSASPGILRVAARTPAHWLPRCDLGNPVAP